MKASICVFCSSAGGAPGWLFSALRDFGVEAARRSWRIVYGGASIGPMGALADAALSEGGDVLGVIPRLLVDREVAHTGLTELRVVPGMHERKLGMTEASDVFVTFPGGVGTLDELFEALSWRQLGLHGKPVVLVNLQGFFDPLLAHVERAREHGLLRGDARQWISVASDVPAAVAACARLVAAR